MTEKTQRGSVDGMPSSARNRILVVDDDPGIRDALSEFLGRHGYDVRSAADASEMDQELAQSPADLIVLDVMMPGEDGLSVCRRLSRSGPPIVMLSAMGEDTDRIVGLEIGADDYLAKPCNPRELLARVRAVLRRREPAADHDYDRLTYTFSGWEFSPDERELLDPYGQIVTMTAGEFALLRAFVEKPQRILNRDQLLEMARGPTAETYDRAIDLQVSRLRRKLDDGSGIELIQTVRGEGYRFVPKVRRR